MSGNTRIEAQATMLNQFLRTQRLFHREDMEKLYQGRVAGGGIGGVGEFGLIDDGRGPHFCNQKNRGAESVEKVKSA